MKILLYILLFFSFSISIIAKYSLINIEITSYNDYEKLIKANFDLIKSSNNSYDLVVNDRDLEDLFLSDISYKIKIDDLEKYNENLLLAHKDFPKLLTNSYFQYGSMSGYFKLEEAYEEFDRMALFFPQFVKKDSIGLTIENRPIYSYKFCNIDSTNKPQVLLNGLIHAREVGTTFTLIYYFWDLLSRYEKNDNLAHYILNNIEITVIPVMNPDGLYFNQVQYPNGGGLWRKNRRKVNVDAYGIDLNRNFGPMESWDAPNDGSSIDPKKDTYRGTAPYSEPEAEAIKDLIENNNFQLALILHTYGNSNIYPISHLGKESSDSSWYRGFCEEIFRTNRYVFGLDRDMVKYSTRGTLDDFLYLGNDKFQKALSLTTEIGSVEHFFWSPIDKMIESATINTKFLDNFVLSATHNIALCDKELVKIDDKFQIKITIQNIGINKIDNLELEVITNDSIVQLSNPNFNIQNFDVADKYSYYIDFTPKNIINGDLCNFKLIANLDTQKEIDFAIPLFKYDEIDLFSTYQIENAWELDGDWSFTDTENSTVLHSNPNSEYSINSDTFAKYLIQSEFDSINRYDLRFEHKYSIEKDYDFGVIWAIDENGNQYNPQFGEYLTRGKNINNTAQKSNLMGFQGAFKYWRTQNLTLAQNSAKIRGFKFNLLTDGATNFEGWQIRNLKLRTYPNIIVSSINNNDYSSGLIIENDLINMGILNITSNNYAQNYKMEIYNLSGILVHKDNIMLEMGLNKIIIPKLEPAYYLVRIFSQNTNYSKGIIIVR